MLAPPTQVRVTTMKHTPKLIAEFLGTFGLTFFGAGAICADRLVRGSAAFGPIDLLLIASAHAVVLGVMVSALGHLSGAHFNPAVTLGALIRRHITALVAAAAGVGGVLDGQHFLIYWLGPAIGGVIAALLYQRLLLRDSAPD